MRQTGTASLSGSAHVSSDSKRTLSELPPYRIHRVALHGNRERFWLAKSLRIPSGRPRWF
jgi:hypothetical protein